MGLFIYIGHLHSNPTKLNQPNRYNVGCDNWNYYPVTLDEIINIKGYKEMNGDEI